MHLYHVRQIVLLIVITFSFFSTKAEDIIVKKTGDIIKSKVLEITQTEIKYKKSSNLDGPTYSTLKSEILSIKYDNGELETFDNSKAETINGQIDAIADDDNNSVCLSYNSVYPIRTDKNKNGSITDYGYAYWGIGQNSIMSTREIEIGLRVSEDSSYYGGCIDLYPYNITITNKSSTPIYIDLGNTFRVSHNGTKQMSDVWYDGATYIENTGKSKGIGLGLGAITNVLGIGGVVGSLANGISANSTSGSSLTIDKSIQRIISVGPYGTVILPGHLSVEDNKVIETFELMEIESKKDFRNKLEIRKWELKKYNEGDLPWKYDFYITYSNDANFSTYTTAPVHLYIRGIYGVGKLETLTKWKDGNSRAINNKYNFDEFSKVLFTRIHIN